MKILVLGGSPNKKGSTQILIDRFKQGAEEVGHTVTVLNAAYMNVHPCTGCIACGYDGPCVNKDDMIQIRQAIMESEMLVFATPLYFFGISAQLKTVIDRFCAFSCQINKRNMKSAFLSVAWNDNDWTMDAIREHYLTLVRYLNLQDMGMVLGTSCGTPAMTRCSNFPQAAYELGKKLR
jgi:multimeric flavodoxin WrbA